MTRRGWTLGSLGIAVLGRAIAGPLPLNYYDVAYALIWGREILHGHLPDYETPGASTPHPLGTLLAAVAAAFGRSWSWSAVEVIVWSSFGLAGMALFVLTESVLGHVSRTALAARGGAAIAVGALLLSPPFLEDAVGGSGLSDVPALALALAAAALAATKPDRHRAPLVLLGLAGLMRPEAWGLAGAYWLYLAYRRRPLVGAAGLVVAAPLLWALSDAIVTGNPTYSLTTTQDAVTKAALVHGVANVPSAAYHGLRSLVGLPVLAVGGAGALGAICLARRAMAPALALLGVSLAEFAALGVADVPLLERFLLIAAAMTSLCFAYAVVALPTRFAAAGTALAAALTLGVAASHASGDIHVRRDQRAAVHAESDLRSLAGRPDVRAVLARCGGALYVARFTIVSLAAYDFDLPPQTVRRTGSSPPARGLILAPAPRAAGVYFGLTPARLSQVRRLALAGSTPIAGDRSWRVYARSCLPPQ